MRPLGQLLQLNTSARTATVQVHDRTHHPQVDMQLRIRIALPQPTGTTKNDADRRNRYACKESERGRGKDRKQSDESVKNWLPTMLRYHRRRYQWPSKSLAEAATTSEIRVPRVHRATTRRVRLPRPQGHRELRPHKPQARSVRWQLSGLLLLLPNSKMVPVTALRRSLRSQPHNSAHQYSQAPATQARKTRSLKFVPNHSSRSNTKAHLRHRSH